MTKLEQAVERLARNLETEGISGKFCEDLRLVLAALRRCEGALEFYASQACHILDERGDSAYDLDDGDKARDALEGAR